MEISKYLNNVSENEERKINEFLAKYPKLDEYELLEMVKKELPSTNIVRTFCSIIDRNWKILRKTSLVAWDITVYLDTIGFVGTQVEKYYLGLVLNHIYCEYASAKDIKDLIENIVNYLKDQEKTYSKFIETLKRTRLGKMNIPYDVLLNMATADVEEYEQMLERLEKAKEYERNNP